MLTLKRAHVRTAAPSTGSGPALGCPLERSPAIFVAEAQPTSTTRGYSLTFG